MKRKLGLIYGAFWLVLLGLGVWHGKAFLASSQVAFFASLGIAWAGFKSYERRVLSRLADENFIQTIKENDEDDDMDEGSDENFTLQDEKARLKEQGVISNLKNINLTAALFPYRLIAYAALFVGFLALQRNGNLDIVGFLIGIAPMPLGALVLGVLKGRDDK